MPRTHNRAVSPDSSARSSSIGPAARQDSSVGAAAGYSSRSGSSVNGATIKTKNSTLTAGVVSDLPPVSVPSCTTNRPQHSSSARQSSSSSAHQQNHHSTSVFSASSSVPRSAAAVAADKANLSSSKKRIVAATSHLPPHPPSRASAGAVAASSSSSKHSQNTSSSSSSKDNTGSNILVSSSGSSSSSSSSNHHHSSASVAASIVLRRVPLCSHNRCWFSDTTNDRGHTLRRRVEEHVRRTRKLEQNSFSIIFTKLWMKIMERYPTLLEPHGAAVTDVLYNNSNQNHVPSSSAATSVRTRVVPHRPATASAAVATAQGASPRRSAAAIASSSSSSPSSLSKNTNTNTTNNNDVPPSAAVSVPHRRLMDAALVNQTLRSQFSGFVHTDAYFRSWPHEEWVCSSSASENNQHGDVAAVSNDGSNSGASTTHRHHHNTVRFRNVTTLGALLRPRSMSWSMSSTIISSSSSSQQKKSSENNSSNINNLTTSVFPAHSSRVVDPPVRFDLFLCSIMHSTGEDGEPYAFIYALFLLHLLGTIQVMDFEAENNNSNNIMQRKMFEKDNTAASKKRNTQDDEDAAAAATTTTSSQTEHGGGKTSVGSGDAALGGHQTKLQRSKHVDKNDDNNDDCAAAAAAAGAATNLNNNKCTNTATANFRKMPPMFPGIGVGQQLRLATALICLGHKYVADAEYTMGYFLKCLPPLFANEEDNHNQQQRQRSNDCSCVVWDRKEMIRLEEAVLVKLEMFGRVPMLNSKQQLVDLLCDEYGTTSKEREILMALFEHEL